MMGASSRVLKIGLRGVINEKGKMPEVWFQ